MEIPHSASYEVASADASVSARAAVKQMSFVRERMRGRVCTWSESGDRTVRLDDKAEKENRKQRKNLKTQQQNLGES